MRDSTTVVAAVDSFVRTVTVGDVDRVMRAGALAVCAGIFIWALCMVGIALWVRRITR